MRVVLVSTYELGHQPLHLALPAARLLEEGHEVRCLDLSLEELAPDLVDWAEAWAISVPMHTAMRLGAALAERVKSDRPELPLCFYGLYAPVGADRTVGPLADRLIAGEYLEQLASWVGDSGGGKGLTFDLGRHRSPTPARHLLPPLEMYAHLRVNGELVPAGYLEASHGCRHRCLHCPVPAVYGGRFRIVDVESLLADVAQLSAMGARHLTFGDPDFLNGPAHSARVLEEVHAAFPEMTFDITAKVEHLLAHRRRLPELTRMGLLFVVSAFETTNDRILALIDKGHTAVDMSEAVAAVREAGAELRPSWLPYTPWTTRSDPAEIFRFLAAHDLFSSVDPVQLSIRLLIPEGSLLLPVAELAPYLGGYRPDLLTYEWSAADPGTELLQSEAAAIAEAGAVGGEEPEETLARMWAAVSSGETGPMPLPRPDRPRLTEPWFCCAEPTTLQLRTVVRS